MTDPACPHENFDAVVGVYRLTDEEDGPVTAYTAEVRIRCADCGTVFEFIGLPAGVSGERPMVSVDFQEARLPIAPKGFVPKRYPGFEVRLDTARMPIPDDDSEVLRTRADEFREAVEGGTDHLDEDPL